MKQTIKTYILLAFLSLALFGCSGNGDINSVATIPRADTTHAGYAFNRQPLQPSCMAKLPLGAIKPPLANGWMEPLSLKNCRALR